MELEKRYIHMNREKAAASVQITLEDDYNIAENQPDIVRMIQSKGTIRIDETKVTKGHILMKGSLIFTILYQTNMEERRLSAVSGEIPFQENVLLDDVEEYDRIKVNEVLEDLNITMVNHRKFSIRAWIMLNVKAEEVYDEEAVTGIQSVLPLQTKMDQLQILQLTFSNKDTLRIKEDILIPSDKPNIYEILWKNVQVDGIHIQMRAGQVEVSGDIQVFILYLASGQTAKLEWFGKKIPFNGKIELNGVTEEMIPAIKVKVASVELEARTDTDGEERMLHLTLVLELDMNLYEEEKLDTLEDVYALDRQIVPVYEEGHYLTLLAKNETKCTLNEQIQIDAQQEPVLQVCDVSGNIVVENKEVTEEGLQVEGVLAVQGLYITAKDETPIESVEAVIPFHQLIEAKGLEKEGIYELDSRLEQMTLTIEDSTHIDLKATIQLDFMGFEKQYVQRMKEIQENDQDIEVLQKMPGMVGYIAEKEESLWNIAKENHTTIEELMETNHLKEPIIRKGGRLLIIKQVM